MGWASGSRIMSGIIGAIKPLVKDKKLRIELYREIVEVLEADDWDTQSECLGEDPAYDEVYEELYPDDDDGEDDGFVEEDGEPDEIEEGDNES